MSLKMQDLGELGYGGAVTLAEWWDEKRITEGTLTNKDLIKKAGFWTYLGIGIPVTLMSALSWPKGNTALMPWVERMSHGFIYDLSRQVKNAVTALRTTAAAGGRTANDAALQQAQEILRQRQAALSHRSTGGALPAGRGIPGTKEVMPEVISKRGM